MVTDAKGMSLAVHKPNRRECVFTFCPSGITKIAPIAAQFNTSDLLRSGNRPKNHKLSGMCCKPQERIRMLMETSIPYVATDQAEKVARSHNTMCTLDG
ncbi:uncharacterized protein [Physcomitrium patens]|uniref:uncharacterized protein isoform X2 n=1 Tax=Physcomitrium patens TaxID=3218 RepID=UPI003CCE41D7